MNSSELTAERAEVRVVRFFAPSKRGLVLGQAFRLPKEGALKTFRLPDSGPSTRPKPSSGKLSHFVKLHGACSKDVMGRSATETLAIHVRGVAKTTIRGK